MSTSQYPANCGRYDAQMADEMLTAVTRRTGRAIKPSVLEAAAAAACETMDRMSWPRPKPVAWQVMPGVYRLVPALWRTHTADGVDITVRYVSADVTDERARMHPCDEQGRRIAGARHVVECVAADEAHALRVMGYRLEEM